jgi:hypothetical protein
MRCVTVARAIVLFFLGVIVGNPAYAQEPKISVSAGYQDLVYTIAQNEEPLPPGYEWVCPDKARGCQFGSASYSMHGLYVDVAGKVSPNVAIVGEWQWNRSSTLGLLGGDPEEAFPDLRVSVQQFSGGLRISMTRPRFEPFAQLLIGRARVSASAPGESESVSATNLRIGVGIDLMFTGHVGLRGSGSYTHLFTAEVYRNNLAQFGVGVVFKM